MNYTRAIIRLTIERKRERERSEANFPFQTLPDGACLLRASIAFSLFFFSLASPKESISLRLDWISRVYDDVRRRLYDEIVYAPFDNFHPFFFFSPFVRDFLQRNCSVTTYSVSTFIFPSRYGKSASFYFNEKHILT